MPGGYPYGEICVGIDVGAVLTTSRGTVLPASPGDFATAGAFGQLTASCPVDACFVLVQLMFGATFDHGAVDLAIGAAGSEVIIARSLSLDLLGATNPTGYAFPCTIPQGTAISARVVDIADNTLVAPNISLILYEGSFDQSEGTAGLDPLGITTSGVGISVAPSASANTKGSYVQIVASTARDYAGLVIDWRLASANTYLADLAIGGAGSEVTIISNFLIYGAAGGVDPSPLGVHGAYWPIPIPAGTRISARTQASGASSATPRFYLYGAYK